MKDDINYQFSKHYKRTIEDLKQLSGFTPAMEKLISANFNNLKQDVTTVIVRNDNDNEQPTNS